MNEKPQATQGRFSCFHEWKHENRPHVKCCGLKKVYGNMRALDGLSCVIEENKITGLIGRNGAGKSTLLKIVSGMVKETSGEIKVFSQHPFNNLIVSANTIFIHEGMALPASLNLKALLDAGASFYNNWDKELADRLFDYFSFQPFQHYDSLSKGKKSIFRSIFGISARCPLTLFDEPTTGMDAAVRKDFYRALLKDYLSHPRTIIISSHHLDEIEDLLEDLLLIDNGKEILHMPIADFRQLAIVMQGKKAMVEEWTANREIFFTKKIGVESLYSVIRNDFSETELQNARLAGLDFSAVSASDLCVFLTEKTKGGIDDVFSDG